MNINSIAHEEAVLDLIFTHLVKKWDKVIGNCNPRSVSKPVWGTAQLLSNGYMIISISELAL